MSLTFSDVVDAAQTWPAQLTLLCIYGILFKLYVPWFAHKVFAPMMKKHPMVGQWTDLCQKTLKDGYGVTMDKDASFAFGCELIGILTQHFVGALLCAPEVVGVSAAWACIAARHGALFEAGWELQDALTRTYQVLCGGEEGRALNPVALRILFGIHHSLGLSFVLPMNIYFGSNYWYFYTVFLLQGAAAVGIGAQFYGFSLDVSSSAGLNKMKFSVTFAWLFTLYGRLFGWIFCVYKLLSVFYEESRHFFIVGCVLSVLFSLFNVLMVLDTTDKFKKYITMKVDKSKAKRRNSMDIHAEPEGGRAPALMRRVSQSLGAEARMPDDVIQPLLQVA